MTLTESAQLNVRLIRDVWQARRERDLAIELLMIANRHIYGLETNVRLNTEFDQAMFRLDCDHDRKQVAA